MIFFKRKKELKVTPSLLKSIKNKPVGGDTKKNIAAIETVLKRFNIGVDEMFKPAIGPTVTTYSFRPVARVKIKEVKDSIIELRNAISFELKIHPIRITISGAANRKLSEDKVKKLADGSSYYVGEALKLGLIDKLGNMDDVSDYLKTNILDGQKANICW